MRQRLETDDKSGLHAHVFHKFETAYSERFFTSRPIYNVFYEKSLKRVRINVRVVSDYRVH